MQIPSWDGYTWTLNGHKVVWRYEETGPVAEVKVSKEIVGLDWEDMEKKAALLLEVNDNNPLSVKNRNMRAFEEYLKEREG